MAGRSGPQPSDEALLSETDPRVHGGDATGVVDPAALQVARDVLERVNTLLGRTVAGALDDEDGAAPDRDAVVRALQSGWDAATEHARALAATHDARLVELVDLLNVVRTADGAIGTVASGGESSLRRVRECLTALTSLPTLAATLDRIPSAVAGLGFDRVLLSRVDASTWVPSRLYFKGDPKWAEEILETMRKKPLTLDSSLLETQMVRRAVPIRVVNPATRTRMNRLMITLSHTHGYVAAPVVDDGTVIAFLHADCYYQGRVPTQLDLDVLWLFAQALGPMLGRQALAERMAAVRREAEAPLATTARDDVADSPTPTPAPQHGVEPQPAPTHALRDAVTPREADVLALLADGSSNEHISRQLGISLGTVKSHVKRILRRLDVANRSEAASLWVRSEYGDGTSGPARRR